MTPEDAAARLLAAQTRLNEATEALAQAIRRATA